jgi:hypothetical protein
MPKSLDPRRAAGCRGDLETTFRSLPRYLDIATIEGGPALLGQANLSGHI